MSVTFENFQQLSCSNEQPAAFRFSPISATGGRSVMGMVSIADRQRTCPQCWF